MRVRRSARAGHVHARGVQLRHCCSARRSCARSGGGGWGVVQPARGGGGVVVFYPLVLCFFFLWVAGETTTWLDVGMAGEQHRAAALAVRGLETLGLLIAISLCPQPGRDGARGGASATSRSSDAPVCIWPLSSDPTRAAAAACADVIRTRARGRDVAATSACPDRVARGRRHASNWGRESRLVLVRGLSSTLPPPPATRDNIAHAASSFSGVSTGRAYVAPRSMRFGQPGAGRSAEAMSGGRAISKSLAATWRARVHTAAARAATSALARSGCARLVAAAASRRSTKAACAVACPLCALRARNALAPDGACVHLRLASV
jgi:hypothetical protein